MIIMQNCEIFFLFKITLRDLRELEKSGGGGKYCKRADIFLKLPEAEIMQCFFFFTFGNFPSLCNPTKKLAF